jgi:hypothetical protein
MEQFFAFAFSGFWQWVGAAGLIWVFCVGIAIIADALRGGK